MRRTSARLLHENLRQATGVLHGAVARPPPKVTPRPNWIKVGPPTLLLVVNPSILQTSRGEHRRSTVLRRRSGSLATAKRRARPNRSGVTRQTMPHRVSSSVG